MNSYIVHSRKGINAPTDKHSVRSDTKKGAREQVYSTLCSFGREDNIVKLGWQNKADFLANAIVLSEFDAQGYRINR